MHSLHASFKGLKFQLVLSTSLWDHDQHHRETAVKFTAVQDAMQILEGRREGRKATFIYLLHFFLAILYTSDWHQYFLCPSHYSLQLVEKIEVFSAQFCFSAFSLSEGTITLFNATTTAYPSFSSAHSASSFYVPLLLSLFLWTPTGVYSSLQACRKDKHSFSATVSLWSSHNIESLTPLQRV